MINEKDKAKYHLLREKAILPEQIPHQLKFKIATTKDEYLEASKILYDCYLEKGFTSAHPSGLRMTPYHLLPTTTVIIATWNDEIVGTIALIRDNPLGLPLEKVFDLTSMRGQQKVICEVSALAIKPSFRSKERDIFHPLIRFVWKYSLDYFGVDYLVIAVNPKNYDLYEALYFFEPLSKHNQVSQYSFANDNPAMGACLNVKMAYKNLSLLDSDADYKKKLHHFVSNSSDSDCFPNRDFFTHLDSPLSADWIKEFQHYVPELNDNLELQNRISQSLGYSNYLNLLTQNAPTRKRLPVTYKVRNHADVRVVDISERGLKLSHSPSIPFNAPEDLILINCEVFANQNSSVLVKPVWSNENGYTGCSVIKPSQNWTQMINRLIHAPAPFQKENTSTQAKQFSF